MKYTDSQTIAVQHLLPIAPLLARAIKEVFEDGSVTSMFGGDA